jgi:hypothetical protein
MVSVRPPGGKDFPNYIGKTSRCVHLGKRVSINSKPEVFFYLCLMTREDFWLTAGIV